MKAFHDYDEGNDDKQNECKEKRNIIKMVS